jgi:beta-galactosidase
MNIIKSLFLPCISLLICLSAISLISCQKNDSLESIRSVTLLNEWQFVNEDIPSAESPELIASSWESVNVPHDWAISGEFDINNDIYFIQVKEDGDLVKKVRTGYTGGLPHVGVGWYRKELLISEADAGRRVYVEFDGVMSNAQVYVNGEFAGEWPYGYASFSFDVTDLVKFGETNLIAVRAENFPQSSRWYPGAGIYRHARLLMVDPVHVAPWGTFVTTPDVSEKSATVNIQTSLKNKSGTGQNIKLESIIYSPKGKQVGNNSTEFLLDKESTLSQEIKVEKPQLWDISTPNLYEVVTIISAGGKQLDQYRTTFGIRTIEFTNDQGFFLNGQRTQLKGVSLHHDLGPLGAAVNVSSLRHRLKLLQEMGANAIRTTHNPPTPELLDLADEMGFVVIVEAFDEWKAGKVENGYHKLWDDWAEKDLVAMIHRDRNHPSVIMWSLGNEVREQQIPGSDVTAHFLNDISHREDPTRPTTAGFNHVKPTLDNGLADAIDVVGWNYKPQQYESLHEQFPHYKMYGSETASTVDSRGVYHFPARETTEFNKEEPFHISAYGLGKPNWGTIPDREFKALDDFPFMAGEFVWTGFDYLGEPTPFFSEWPSRSSYFGIIDLCGIPKDRYYLYQSHWSEKNVLHMLPHWNWNEGDIVPVHVFTNYTKAELFVNGESQGIKEKDASNLLTTYRLIWEEVPYQAGELKVVALDNSNNPIMEAKQVTAGEPYAIRLEPDRTKVKAGPEELIFVTVSVVDKNGVLCPEATNLISFSTNDLGFVKAVGNGDQTSLESFVKPYRKAFSGKCMAIIQASEKTGKIKIEASSDGLRSESLTLDIIN